MTPIISFNSIISPKINELKNIADGGIIIVQINKFPTPVLFKISKYKRYAITEHKNANNNAISITLLFRSLNSSP